MSATELPQVKALRKRIDECERLYMEMVDRYSDMADRYVTVQDAILEGARRYDALVERVSEMQQKLALKRGPGRPKKEPS